MCVFEEVEVGSVSPTSFHQPAILHLMRCAGESAPTPAPIAENVEVPSFVECHARPSHASAHTHRSPKFHPAFLRYNTGNIRLPYTSPTKTRRSKTVNKKKKKKESRRTPGKHTRSRALLFCVGWRGAGRQTQGWAVLRSGWTSQVGPPRVLRNFFLFC